MAKRRIDFNAHLAAMDAQRGWERLEKYHVKGQRYPLTVGGNMKVPGQTQPVQCVAIVRNLEGRIWVDYLDKDGRHSVYVDKVKAKK